MFTLHPTLEKDTVILGHFPLSLVLLSKDSRYPWCILVPQRSNVRDIHHLDSEDRRQLMEESCYLAESMVSMFAPDKMNVAALGNQVPQLHLHHIARFKDDAAWPNPVWGAHPPLAYSDEELNNRVSRLRSALAGQEFIVSDVAPEPSTQFNQTIET
ncbi:HIT domain-containing protein [Marinibactrum halimedae]|uniref:Histidine triad protein n=1 Tax=Marinibactrum halimedae TaxID=1444977 RepID=A0AA37T3U9_9GAMM|nr:HIT domain-containing protein [Marinibactrum halimedae]MCD9458117.1 HIT domain-containing protein [Marinibactrum halimedae]GLS25051.1 histidine triad protein [Marinibactrum halimedae]